MHNTTVTIKYSNGSTRYFVASDELEELINQGDMFSVTTMHSDIARSEEESVSKMYAGNPIAAMGYMMMMKRNAEKMIGTDDKMPVVIETLTACIRLLSNEVTSHQSNMSPVDSNNVCPVIKKDCKYYSYSVDDCGTVINCCHHIDNSKHDDNCTEFLCPLCREACK